MSRVQQKLIDLLQPKITTAQEPNELLEVIAFLHHAPNIPHYTAHVEAVKAQLRLIATLELDAIKQKPAVLGDEYKIASGDWNWFLTRLPHTTGHQPVFGLEQDIKEIQELYLVNAHKLYQIEYANQLEFLVRHESTDTTAYWQLAQKIEFGSASWLIAIARIVELLKATTSAQVELQVITDKALADPATENLDQS